MSESANENGNNDVGQQQFSAMNSHFEFDEQTMRSLQQFMESQGLHQPVSLVRRVDLMVVYGEWFRNQVDDDVGGGIGSALSACETRTETRDGGREEGTRRTSPSRES